MNDLPAAGTPGFRRGAAVVPLPVDEVIGLLGAASGAGWVSGTGPRTWLITEDPADVAGLVTGASAVNPNEPAVAVWSYVAADGARSGGFLVARAGRLAAHEWSETQNDQDAVQEAQQIVALLETDVEPYLLRAMLRQTGDPEDLIVQALHLLDLDPRLHTLLVEGPGSEFAATAPPGGIAAWSAARGPRGDRPRWWRRQGRRSGS